MIGAAGGAEIDGTFSQNHQVFDNNPDKSENSDKIDKSDGSDHPDGFSSKIFKLSLNFIAL